MQGDRSDEIYIVESGVVSCQMDFLALSGHMQAMQNVPKAIQAHSSMRMFDYGPGGIVGELDFFLQRPRSFKASCLETAQLLCLPR